MGPVIGAHLAGVRWAPVAECSRPLTRHAVMRNDRKDHAMTPQQATPDTEVVHVITRDSFAVEYQRAIEAIPDAEDASADDMMAQLMNATSLEELADDSGLGSSKSLLGHTMRIDTIGKRESEKDSTTGWYLICTGTDTISRKPVTFGTSSDKVMVKLAKLHQLGGLPAIVKIVGGTSKKGNEFLDLEIIAAGGKILKQIG